MYKTFAVLCLVASATLAAQEFQDDFTQRPSLSNGDQGYVIWGDKCYVKACSHEPNVGRTAPGSLRIQAHDFNGPASGFFVKFLPVQLQKGYNLMVYAQKQDVSPKAKIQVRILGRDQQKKPIYRYASIDCNSFQDKVWKRLIVALPPIPQGGEKAITIELGATNLERGTIWFDDLECFPDEQ